MGCQQEGPPPAQFDLGPQRWVTVGRMQVRLHSGSEETLFPIPLPSCRAVVLPVTHTRLGGRDFLEYFVWISGHQNATTVHGLLWMIWEIQSDAVRERLVETIYETMDSSYPEGDLPEGFRNMARLRAVASGEVEWTVARRPPKRGVF